VKGSDATLRFATDWESPGEVLTQRMCVRYGRPHLDVSPGDSITPADVAEWLVRNAVRVLNVAGNTERTSPGIAAFVTAFLGEVIPAATRRRGRGLAQSHHAESSGSSGAA
jgi:hypothetical protein